MRLKNCVRVPWKEGLPRPCGSGLLPTFFPSGWSVAAAILPTVLLSLVCEQGHGAKVLLWGLLIVVASLVAEHEL